MVGIFPGARLCKIPDYLTNHTSCTYHLIYISNIFSKTVTKRKRDMIVFQVSSRSVQLTTPPKKRTRFLPYQRYIIARVLGALLFASLIFGLFAIPGHSDIVFFLIPVLLSLTTAQPQRYNIDKLLNGTPVYL